MNPGDYIVMGLRNGVLMFIGQEDCVFDTWAGKQRVAKVCGKTMCYDTWEIPLMLVQRLFSLKMMPSELNSLLYTMKGKFLHLWEDSQTFSFVIIIFKDNLSAVHKMHVVNCSVVY